MTEEAVDKGAPPPHAACLPSDGKRKEAACTNEMGEGSKKIIERKIKESPSDDKISLVPHTQDAPQSFIFWGLSNLGDFYLHGWYK